MPEYEARRVTGGVVNPGDKITNFRGEPAEFVRVERGPEPGKSALVEVSRNGTRRTFYSDVYGLKVVEVK